MKPYAERKIFAPWMIRIWREVSALIEALPHQRDNVAIPIGDSPSELRCHELTRAVFLVDWFDISHIRSQPTGLARAQMMRIVDGKYGMVEHSWLELVNSTEQFTETAILDVYAPGRLPQVQLIDGTQLLPEFRAYQRGETRTDVREDVVAAIGDWMVRRRAVDHDFVLHYVGQLSE